MMIIFWPGCARVRADAGRGLVSLGVARAHELEAGRGVGGQVGEGGPTAVGGGLALGRHARGGHGRRGRRRGRGGAASGAVPVVVVVVGGGGGAVVVVVGGGAVVVVGEHVRGGHGGQHGDSVHRGTGGGRSTGRSA